MFQPAHLAQGSFLPKNQTLQKKFDICYSDLAQCHQKLGIILEKKN